MKDRIRQTFRVHRHTVALFLALAASIALSACGGSASDDDSTADATPSSSTPAPKPTTHLVANHGHQLAFHVTPGGLPAIVLDAGGGLDSSQWKDIVPELAKRTGSMIITYDRAGMGASDEVRGPFKLANAVSDLEAGLRELGVSRDVVLVSHSLAGEVATYFVQRYPAMVSGAVLVDASLPPFFTDSTTAALVKAKKAQIEALKDKPSTKQSRQLLALATNYGPVHRAYHKVTWPGSIPAIVMVSEKTPFDVPPLAKLWKAAQSEFADAASNRRLVVAAGSSHNIPADRPELVVKTIVEMAKMVGK